MGLIELASADSVWRGMDYYEKKRVISWKPAGDTSYDGQVSGSNNQDYLVHIDKDHPRKSTCNCPFAAGRRVVCKHMIALYFTAEPKVAEDFMKQAEEWEKEGKEGERQHYIDLKKYVNGLSKDKLRQELYNALVELEDIRRRYW